MITVSVRSNVEDVMRRHRLIARDQLPFATAKALTLAAKAAQKALIDEQRRVFDRPTPFSLGGTYVKPATKTDLVAIVKLKDEVYKGTAAVKFLAPEVEGGGRNHKRFELALIAHGLMPSNMYAVPGERVRLDAYGNIPASVIVQILSALGSAERSSGYMMNRTARSAKRNKKRADYFVGQPGNGKGPLGIWQRIGKGARPIIIFVKSPTYSQRYDFYGVGERAATAAFEPIFIQALTDAIASRST